MEIAKQIVSQLNIKSTHGDGRGWQFYRKRENPTPTPARPSHAHQSTLPNYLGGANQVIQPANDVTCNYKHEKSHACGRAYL